MTLNLNDITANGNVLTNVHSVADITTSLPFPASTDAAGLTAASTMMLTAADSTSLSITNNLTLESWVKYTTANTDGNIYNLIVKVNAYRIYVSWNDTTHVNLLCEIWDNGKANRRRCYVTLTVATGTWYHYAVTFTPANSAATQFEFFVNGSSIGNGTLTGDAVSNINDSSDLLELGSNSSSEYLDGVLDEVRIWNTIRTQPQISADYQSKLTGSESGLMAYYSFDPLVPTTNYLKKFRRFSFQ